MKIAVGSDHAGFALKIELAALCAGWGHAVEDVGAFDDSPSDYPDFARKIALAVTSGACERGILVCGSGVGASAAWARRWRQTRSRGFAPPSATTRFPRGRASRTTR